MLPCNTGSHSAYQDTPGHTERFKYKNNFSIGPDGVPVCKEGLRMYKDGNEPAKHRAKCRCPKANRKVNVPVPMRNTDKLYIYITKYKLK